MAIGWTCVVVAQGGDVELEQLDGAGVEWYAEGPAGVGCGTLAEVLATACAEGYEKQWLDAVAAGIAQEVAAGPTRHALLVKRGGATMFHASRSRNRASIARHGLDWRRMGDAPGIAGSCTPERPGVFLCAERDDARWFAGMPRTEPGDVWRVHSDDGVWLYSDPSAGGGLDDCWVICPAPIPAAHVELVERDVHSR